MIASLSLEALGFIGDSPVTVARVAEAGGFRGAHLRLERADRAAREALTDVVAGGMFLPTWVFPLDGLFADDAEQRRRWERTFQVTAPFAVDLGVSVVSSHLPASVTARAAGLSGIRAAGMVHRLQWAAGAARDVGLTLGIAYEPVAPAPGSLAGMMDLLDGVGLGLVADAAHLAGIGAFDPNTPTRWVDRVVDVHLVDPTDERRSPAGTSGPAGMARLRPRRPPVAAEPGIHAALLRMLVRADYRGPVMLGTSAEPGLSPGVAAVRARALLAGFLADCRAQPDRSSRSDAPDDHTEAGRRARLAPSAR